MFLQALFTLYGFHFPLTVALLQMGVIAPVCYAVARPKLDWALARSFLPLSLVNVLNVICGLMGKSPGVCQQSFRLPANAQTRAACAASLTPQLLPCRHCWFECANVYRFEKIHATLYNSLGAGDAAQESR